ncbi:MULTISPECIES: hypothetical protein [Bacillaceae]|uniref:Uncharacterized protein n=1 Tax=Niallia hominis TaxID=3133173 RepID=A0ABV1EVD2_9BACI|nr:MULTISPECIES: hypothetical protein [Bacillaceae]MCF2648865.1 hypothetical protein [Niallia circulans]MCM3362398.1 hypothetical protein [Niallia sp. MER TA 168]CAI9395886.1 hypothetical protein BACSP_04193 [Bacillus sp. T2.9-1]
MKEQIYVTEENLLLIKEALDFSIRNASKGILFILEMVSEKVTTSNDCTLKLDGMEMEIILVSLIEFGISLLSFHSEKGNLCMKEAIRMEQIKQGYQRKNGPKIMC